MEKSQRLPGKPPKAQVRLATTQRGRRAQWERWMGALRKARTHDGSVPGRYEWAQFVDPRLVGQWLKEAEDKDLLWAVTRGRLPYFSRNGAKLVVDVGDWWRLVAGEAQRRLARRAEEEVACWGQSRERQSPEDSEHGRDPEKVLLGCLAEILWTRSRTHYGRLVSLPESQRQAILQTARARFKLVPEDPRLSPGDTGERALPAHAMATAILWAIHAIGIDCPGAGVLARDVWWRWVSLAPGARRRVIRALNQLGPPVPLDAGRNLDLPCMARWLLGHGKTVESQRAWCLATSGQQGLGGSGMSVWSAIGVLSENVALRHRTLGNSYLTQKIDHQVRILSAKVSSVLLEATPRRWPAEERGHPPESLDLHRAKEGELLALVRGLVGECARRRQKALRTMDPATYGECLRQESISSVWLVIEAATRRLLVLKSKQALKESPRWMNISLQGGERAALVPDLLLDMRLDQDPAWAQEAGRALIGGPLGWAETLVERNGVVAKAVARRILESAIVLDERDVLIMTESQAAEVRVAAWMRLGRES